MLTTLTGSVGLIHGIVSVKSGYIRLYVYIYPHIPQTDLCAAHV